MTDLMLSQPAVDRWLVCTGKEEWETPQELFDMLNDEFHFTLDVSALPENAKCERFFSPSDDGLVQKWEGVCWMNPPYGKTIGLWVKKAFESATGGATVVCLLPASTDTRWFHAYIMGRAELRFVKGRIKFGKSGINAPFASMIVVFRPDLTGTTYGAQEQINRQLELAIL